MIPDQHLTNTTKNWSDFIVKIQTNFISINLDK